MKKAALIVAGGKKPSKKMLKAYFQKSDVVIAADHGGDYLKSHRLIPDALVGDFDSIDAKTLKWFENKDVKIHMTKPEKDETDTMLAVLLAKGLKADIVYILGGMGKRLDHMLANIALLSYAKARGIKAYLLDECNEVFLLDEKNSFVMDLQDNLSLFSITESSKFRSSSGLKYSLNHLTLNRDYPIGTSNLVIDTHVNIEIEFGCVMAIRSK
jgi:thiamine pyrophosphokinase